MESIQRSIDAATEEQYLEGLQRAKEALKLIYSPPMPDHKRHQELPKEDLKLDPNHGANPQRHMIPRDDLKGISAEGSGREVLLQANHPYLFLFEHSKPPLAGLQIGHKF